MKTEKEAKPSVTRSKKLRSLWKKRDMVKSKSLKEALDNGFAYSTYTQSEKPIILVTGINPSYRTNDKFTDQFELDYDYSKIIESKKDNYYQNIHSVLPSDFKNKFQLVYSDLFYVRQTDQASLKQFFADEDGLKFMTAQLKITMEFIRDVSPALIVVFNKGSWNYWGKNFNPNARKHKNAWMGFDFVGNEESKHLCLHKFNGMLEVDQSIYKNFDLGHLKDTPIYFSKYLRFLGKPEKDSIRDELERISKRLG
jgi:hypothetical protein